MDLGGNMEKQGKFETQELRVRKKTTREDQERNNRNEISFNFIFQPKYTIFSP